MNLVFGSEVAQLGFWEYMFGILLTVFITDSLKLTIRLASCAFGLRELNTLETTGNARFLGVYLAVYLCAF